MKRVRKSIDLDKELLRILQHNAIMTDVSIKVYLEAIIERHALDLKSKNSPKTAKV